VDGFFRTAFPGSSFEMEPFPFGAYESDEPPASPFALSCVTPEYAPSPADAFQAEPPLPFGRFTNRDEAREAMAAHIIDPGPYRPLGDSRWGGIFDILTDEAVEETLSRYKVVTLLGHMPLEAAFRRALVRFVSEGGVLVASAGVLGPEDIDLTGVRMKPELAVGRGWTWRDEPLQAEAFRYVPGAPVNEAQSVVLARAATGQPIIVRTRIGEGCVYVCQIPWFEGEAQPLAGAARRLFDQVYGLIQPVRVDGPPAQWTSARGEGRRTVAISNHGQQVWRGTVCVRGFDAALRACHELVSGRRVDFRRGLTEAAVELAIPPHDVRVLRFSR
jgi:hypothetical protein